MEILPADYALVGMAVAGVGLGLWRGLSGMIAFLCATLAGITAGFICWRHAPDFVSNAWACVALTGIGALLAFGVVRAVFKRFVRVLLAQPSDSIFGFVAGAALGVLPTVGWALSGVWLEYSNLATFVSGLLASGAVAV